MEAGIVALLERLARDDDWAPRPPGGMELRPRFRLRQWTLGVELRQSTRTGERVAFEAGFRLPPRRRGWSRWALGRRRGG